MSININAVDIKEYSIKNINVGSYVEQKVSIDKYCLYFKGVQIEDYLNQEIRIIDGSANN